jgi:hypothetical protein
MGTEADPIGTLLRSPGVPFEFEDQWRARASSRKLFRFDRVLIADRWSGHMAYTSKPMYVNRNISLPLFEPN